MELSVLTEAAFARLAGLAFHVRQAGEADAFLIALDQDADYDNPNFRWMRSRFERFVYVDRVVVAARARGLDTCPQASFLQFHRVIREELGMPDSETVVCGMALGYADPDAKENSLRTERAPTSEWVRFRD